MKAIRWLALGFLGIGLAACGGVDGQRAVDTTVGESTTSADPAAEEPTATEPAASEPAASEPETGRPAPATFEAGASVLTDSFAPLEPGTYRVDTLGTPFSFTSAEPLFVQPNGRGTVVLTHPGSAGPDDRDIVILRMSVLSNPAEVIPGSGAVADWPATDFGGWLDNLSDEVVVTDRRETTLGGRDAIHAELALGETDCTSRIPCRLGWNQVEGKAMAAGSTYRVWMVDQGDEDPIAVIVGINRESELEWFETADEVLATLAFDEVGPNPVVEASGVVELDLLGGLRAELVEPAMVIQEPAGYGAIAPLGLAGDIDFLLAPNDIEGGPVATTTDLVTILEEAGVAVLEIEATEIDGIEARVFDVGVSNFVELLTRSVPAQTSWSPPPRGRIWSVEHPERGLLVVTAEAFSEPDTVFPLILDLTEPLVDSMEFVDLG